MSDAIVIVATVGKPTLRRSVESILKQSYTDLTCLVVCDGVKHEFQAEQAIREFRSDSRLQFLTLPQNTGANGFVCHRIYGAMPLLVNQEYILYCDDDNWLDPDHVRNLVNACVENQSDWSHSLRNIYKDGEFLCRDECESLGQWPVWCADHFHVDTNCFCIKRDVAVTLAPRWHKSRIENGQVKMSADTEITNYLRIAHPNFVTVPEFTVNYELGSWELSPKPEFFLTGNAAMAAKFQGEEPWNQ